MSLEQDQRISDVVKRDQPRLRNFIRRRVPDPRDAEDILQEVFYELVEANRLLMPIEHVTGWLFNVALSPTLQFALTFVLAFGSVAMRNNASPSTTSNWLAPSIGAMERSLSIKS